MSSACCCVTSRSSISSRSSVCLLLVRLLLVVLHGYPLPVADPSSLARGGVQVNGRSTRSALASDEQAAGDELAQRRQALGRERFRRDACRRSRRLDDVGERPAPVEGGEHRRHGDRNAARRGEPLLDRDPRPLELSAGRAALDEQRVRARERAPPSSSSRSSRSQRRRSCAAKSRSRCGPASPRGGEARAPRSAPSSPRCACGARSRRSRSPRSRARGSRPARARRPSRRPPPGVPEAPFQRIGVRDRPVGRELEHPDVAARAFEPAPRRLQALAAGFGDPAAEDAREPAFAQVPRRSRDRPHARACRRRARRRGR